MADYHAVLQRTLSGFSNPKSELRAKLYDRARTTIARQLESRTPAVTGDALAAELEKLEQSIFQIERTYDPSYPEPVPKSAKAATPAAPKAAPAKAPPPAATENKPAASQTPTEPPRPPSFADARATSPPDPGFVDTPPAAAPPSASPAETAPSPQVEQPVPEPEQAEPAASEPQPGFEPLQPPTAAVEPEAVAQVEDDPVVDQWAEEFLSQQPAPAHPHAHQPYPPHPGAVPNAPPLPHELQPGQPVPQTWPPQQHDPSAAGPYGHHAYAPHPHMPPGAPGQEYQHPYGAPGGENPGAPPAPGFGNGGKRRRKGGFFKWVFRLLILCLLGAAGYFGWMHKEMLLEQVGMSHLLDDPTRPKPVKTIAITPENGASDEAGPEAKVESRLNEDGQEETPPESSPAPTPALQPVLEPVAEVPADGTVPVAQNAILYEEGATAAENTVDAGRVVWSVIEEEPASGAPKEPAIRARIEIPGRNVVLIMKIKRNADKALPASHLIELVFAVPDDFSGGVVDQVSRFVLKQSEQGRGDGLVGVPARIADGIFLIALNNLAQAKEQNEALLQTRAWIDIPLQYRTGRRALMTIEKGVPGDKVFAEVFEAWSKL